MVGLVLEVGVELLPTQVEKAPQLLNHRPLHEQRLILKLRPVLRVVAHQVLPQEDTRVEPLPDRCVNRVYQRE